MGIQEELGTASKTGGIGKEVYLRPPLVFRILHPAVLRLVSAMT